MPTITEILRRGRSKPLPTLPALQRRVLEYLDAHPDEVLSYGDADELASKLGVANGKLVQGHLSSLDSKGLVAKTKLGRNAYLGSRFAVNQLALASITVGEWTRRVTEGSDLRVLCPDQAR